MPLQRINVPVVEWRLNANPAALSSAAKVIISTCVDIRVNDVWFETDVFHDVDLATPGPAKAVAVHAEHPDSRPDATAPRQLRAHLEAPTAPFDDWHVYALEWHSDRLDFFVDDKKYFTYPKETDAKEDVWPFDQPCYLILNLAIGGTWGGQHGIDDAIFPQRFEIDYVRIYQRAD
jgi:hypothetical protein